MQDYQKEQKQVSHPLFRVRQRIRRGSDGMIDVNYPQKDYIENEQKLILKMKKIREENPFELPILKERIQYSYIWDKFTFQENIQDEDLIRVDITDKRINFEQELNKFLLYQEQKQQKTNEQNQ